MSTFVGLNALVKDTGETPRTLQHWTDIGILRVEPPTEKKGRGYHRLYRAEAPKYGERTWALIASELNRARMPLADIKMAVDVLRKGFTEPHKGGNHTYGVNSHPVGRALGGRLVVLLLVFDKDNRFAWRTAIDIDNVDEVEPHTVWKADELGLKEDHPVYDNVTLKIPLDLVRDHNSSLLLNLTGILAPLRVLPEQEV